MVRQVLGSTPLYPDWQRALVQQGVAWKGATPDWSDILKQDLPEWNAAVAAAEQGPKVLVALSSGGFGSNTVESMLAVALTLRGARVHVLLCDQHLPACFIQNIGQFPDADKFAKHGPMQMCDSCFSIGDKLFQPLGLPTHRHSQQVSRVEIQKARALSLELPMERITDYRFEGVAVGEHALASAVHYFARGDVKDEPHGEAVLRRYLFASLLAMFEIRRLLNTYSFECVFFHHGMYVPHGVFSEVARQQNVRRVAWSPAYRNQTFVLSHEDTYHRTMLSEPTNCWEDLPWTREMEKEIVDYLQSRWQGTQDWISYQQKTQENISVIARELEIDFSKPTIGLLTNVMWDAQIHYPSTAFPSMVDWVLQTIRHFANRPDLQLIIRVHPAEVLHPIRSRQPIVDEIRRTFPALPRNVFIIPPEKLANTYAVMQQCDSVIIYATKTGVELAGMGIPVIVAGAAWIRGKGISLDASSPEEYFTILDRLPLRNRLSEAVVQRALKYAYHFFFRRMIPLPFVVPPWPITLDVSGLDDLRPGRSTGLDLICNGILNRKEFIYPYELHPESLDTQSQVSRLKPDQTRRMQRPAAD